MTRSQPEKPKAADIRERVERQAQETAASCLAFRVRALSRRLTSLYEDALRPIGIKATQLNVMTAVAASRGEVRLSKIAETIALEPSSLSRIIDVMRRNGWVEFLPDPDDDRARLVRLTDAGAALYAEAIPLWRQAQADAHALLGEGGADALTELANQTLSLKIR